MRELLLGFKLNSRLALGAVFGDLLVEAFRFHFPEQPFDVIVPVPIHRRRLFFRGFNQSLELARLLACRVTLPVAAGALKKNRPTPPQRGLARKERMENVKNSFAADPGTCRGKQILLLDDVLTTGSTLTACTREIKRAGAKSVHVLVAARA